MSSSWLDTVRAQQPMPRLVDLPPRYAGARFSACPEGPVKDAIARYVRDFETHAAAGIAPVFLGRARQYKSFGAALLAQHAWLQGLDTAWLAARRLATEDFDAVRDLLQRLERVPFVVVDDFHVLRTAHQRQALEALLSARFDALRPTVFTGNVPIQPKDYWAPLDTEWGPTFTRRLRDGGRGFIVFIA